MPSSHDSQPTSPEEIPALLCEIYAELERLQQAVTLLSGKISPALRPQNDTETTTLGNLFLDGPLPVTSFGKTLRDHLVEVAKNRERIQDLYNRLAI